MGSYGFDTLGWVEVGPSSPPFNGPAQLFAYGRQGEHGRTYMPTPRSAFLRHFPLWEEAPACSVCVFPLIRSPLSRITPHARVDDGVAGRRIVLCNSGQRTELECPVNCVNAEWRQFKRASEVQEGGDHVDG